MIEVDYAKASAAVKAIRDATSEFDEAAASKNPEPGDTGAAQAMLADVLATSADVALRLVHEVDTLAISADAGLADLSTFDRSMSTNLQGMGWSLE
ncbi:hypothetical protein [Demequina aurantiaca]|uniref:hypothetical protein n=1 Tax=Demequina aurantiaca TaxID=676200 RepID=UPI0007851283|nr:hypothetical protein [Demequina aurantiaca]